MASGALNGMKSGHVIVLAYCRGNYVELNDEQVYLKSEADKVIAEKDKELRRQKYKRCLKMAMWCKDEMQHYKYDDKVIFYGFRFYERWEKRWLELAEKFKEAK